MQTNPETTQAARNKHLPRSSDFHDLHSDVWTFFPLMKRQHKMLLQITLFHKCQSLIAFTHLWGIEL